jgi:hypothetical protein
MELLMDGLKFRGRSIYEIKIQNHLGEKGERWFEGMTVTKCVDEEGTPLTILTGLIRDQAALHGLLTTIRDMNLTLISVNRISTETEDDSARPDQ